MPLSVKWYRSIGFKLFVLVCFFLILGSAGITYHNSLKFKKILEDQVAQIALNRTNMSLSGFKAKIKLTQSHLLQILSRIHQLEKQSIASFVEDIVNSNGDYVSFGLTIETESEGNRNSDFWFYPNRNLDHQNFQHYNPTDVLEFLKQKSADVVATVKQDRLKIVNVAKEAKVPINLVILRISDQESNKIVWATLAIWSDSLAESLNTEPGNKVFVTDEQGFLLVSTQVDELQNPSIYRKHPIIKVARTSKTASGVVSYRVKSDKESRIGAYSIDKNLSVIIFNLKDPREAQLLIQKELLSSVLLVVIFVMILLFIIYFASKSFVKKIELITDYTHHVALGNFSSHVQIDSSDELQILSQSINSMSNKIQDLMVKRVKAAEQAKELETAKFVQNKFIPKNQIDSFPFTISGNYFSASECGGDWWGYFVVDEEWDFVGIADATGHGAAAALVTAIAYTSASLAIKQVPTMKSVSAAQILASINQVFWEAGHGLTTMTFFAGLLNKKTGEFVYANAGHNFPFVVPYWIDDPRFESKKQLAKRKNYVPLVGQGNPLGIEPQLKLTDHRTILMPGDNLYLFTDGIIECKNSNGKMWGKKNFTQCVEHHNALKIEEISEGILQNAFAFYQDTPLEDDVTLVIIHVDPDFYPKDIKS